MSFAGEINVRVPASSANLGPGFDTLGLALGLYLRCKLKHSSGMTRSLKPRITLSGPEASGIPSDETNLIWKTFTQHVAQEEGDQFDLTIENDIPLSRGLGSSAAAILAGLALASEFSVERGSARRSRQEILELASGIEGHPDNVAAALLGGLVASCQTATGGVLALPCTTPGTLEIIVVIPSFQLSTEAARAALPQEYPRRDAVFNLQRLAIMLAALQNGRMDLMGEAMKDRIHQPYRAALVPGFAEALELKNLPGLLGLALSGAGPSVVAFCENESGNAGANPVAEAIQGCFARHGVESRAMRLPIDHQGLLIERSA